ncbi:unnamed protein product [Rhodiola kirilowii]
MASASQHRCVFVGNIPYDVSEEQLIQICEEVGPVVSFRLVTDKETGKPKGYGFCEYKDEETALSARRNLQGYEINGRQLRVDFAENDKGIDRSREQVRGGPGPSANIGVTDLQKLGDASNQQQIGTSAAASAASVMARALGGSQVGIRSNPNGQSVVGNDPLTLYLAQMSRNQLNEVLHQFKEMATQNKNLTRELLVSNPQLSKAFFQVLIMLRMVPQQVLQMPNIRQASTSVSQNGSQPQLSAQAQSGLPPLPQNKLDSSVLPKMEEGQSSATAQNPLVLNQSPISHFHQLLQTQPNVYPVQSGVTEYPSTHSQQILSSTARPHNHFATPSTTTHQMQPHVVQNSRQVGSTQLHSLSQSVSLNGNLQTASCPRPAAGDPRYQLGSTSQGTLQTKGQEVGRSTQMNANSAQRAPTSNNRLQDLKSSNITPGIREPTPRPLRPVKLEDERGASLPASSRPLKQVKLEDGSSGVPVRVVGCPLKPVKMEEGTFSATATGRELPNASVSSNQNTRPGVQPIEKQTLQLPPGMDPGILEQVLKLTPEQLSLLPPEQQQEVIQLQKMLNNSA